MANEYHFDYHYGNVAEQYTFYRIPKMLFTHARFSGLSCEAKVLYGLMLDRMGLSIKNRWFDEQNRVFIIFRINDIMEALHCAEQKANRLLVELDTGKGIGLIERKRQGLGKPNIIYVKNFIVNPTNSEQPTDYSTVNETACNPPAPRIKTLKSTRHTNHNFRIVKIKNQEIPESQDQICENHKSKNVKIACPDLRFSQGLISNTEVNDIDPNDTDSINPSISPVSAPPYPVQTAAILPRHQSAYPKPERFAAACIDSYRDLIRRNIDYDVLSEQYNRERLDELVEIMTETICTNKQTINISGDSIPAEVVRSRLLKLNMFHLEYILDQLAKTTTKIYNIHSYLLTALYRAPTTISNFYSATVNHDMYEK